MRSLVGLLLMTFVLVQCASSQKTPQVQEEWINNMHRLSAAHLRLMPIVADNRKFTDPTQRTLIKAQLTQLALASSAIANDNKAPNVDPIIAFTANKFAEEAHQAYVAFEANDTQWARFSLSRTSRYCISCHTRADRGVRDFQAAWNTQTLALNPFQAVEVLMANRRYQSALQAAETLARDGASAHRDPRSWILILEKTLAMIVRVNKSPQSAESLIKLVIQNNEAPAYIRRDAQVWLDDTRQWNKERSQNTSFAQLVKTVNRAQQASAQNRSPLISYLRASGMAHELLENPRVSTYGETLYYAGITSEALRDLNAGYLDQYYYEACIRETPHSLLAEKCYQRFEAAIRAANPLLDLASDSDWPVALKLDEMRRLAEVKDRLNERQWNQRFGKDLDNMDNRDDRGSDRGH